uniref:Glypican-1 n=1 Tax=Neolamprologus brichardi TaxID=32507 RepID=A0A3Q4GUJ2_NEOBR
MKLLYCPHCRGVASAKPCSSYCANVMKGCLANQADLNPEWQNLIVHLTILLNKKNQKPSLDVVLSSIPVRIYEAVHYLQENMDAFTAKASLCDSTPILVFYLQITSSSSKPFTSVLVLFPC